MRVWFAWTLFLLFGSVLERGTDASETHGFLSEEAVGGMTAEDEIHGFLNQESMGITGADATTQNESGHFRRLVLAPTRPSS